MAMHLRLLSWTCMCLVSTLVPHATSTPRSPVPPWPAGQTPFQRDLTANISLKAIGLSENATASLLSLLGSTSVNKTLAACCPDWVNRSPTQILNALREFVANAEVVHNFDAVTPTGRGGMRDVNLSLASRTPYFLNQWQLDFSNLSSGCTNPSEANAERAIFGFSKFSSSRQVVDFGKQTVMPFPKTFAEAAVRPVYAALNMLRTDGGSGNFGDVGVVFNRSYVNPMLILSPCDTGSWELRCNSSAPPWLKTQFPVNCSAWTNLELGCWNHFDHIILMHLSMWETASAEVHLAHLLTRVFAPRTHQVNISLDDQLQGYIEADIAGNVAYPEGVHFVVASFASLFGSRVGEHLQTWCTNNRWPLVWALGPLGAGSSGNTTFSGLDRIVDPLVLRATTLNRTISSSTMSRFKQLWLNATHQNATRLMWDTVANVVGESLVVRALSAVRRCEAVTSCIGVDELDDCACFV
eukprot:m.87735 g.87735  ORF g.87735 m.87735 type:complete len:468 (+) comp26113_c0_seq1:140-1543(+)